MADGLKDIMASLEKQRVAIEKALEALKEVDGSVTVAAPAQPTAKRRGRKPGPQAKKAAPAKAAPATRKGLISEEGRAKLAEAMKRRWAAKRAGAKATKAKAKKAAKKKAAA
jgi:DNA-binding protein HU-beta